MRRMGTPWTSAFRISSTGAKRRMPSVPSIGPGMTPLTRIPSTPHSMASVFVTMSTPALAAHTWTCIGIAITACGAEMLMMLAPGLVRCGYAPRMTLNVPRRSISTTDLNPFGLRLAAGDGKFPAAPRRAHRCCRAWRRNRSLHRQPLGPRARRANTRRRVSCGLLRGQEVGRGANLLRVAARNAHDRAARRKRLRDAEVDPAGAAENEDSLAAEIERGVHVLRALYFATSIAGGFQAPSPTGVWTAAPSLAIYQAHDERMQVGRRSPAMTGGVFSPAYEETTHEFQKTLLARFRRPGSWRDPVRDALAVPSPHVANRQVSPAGLANAAARRTKSPAYRVGFYLVPGFPMMAFAAAIEPLRAANRLSGERLFDWRLVSRDGKPVRASNGIDIDVHGASRRRRPARHAAGLRRHAAMPDAATPRWLKWLRALARGGVALGGISLGAYALADAGLLDGRRCALHWESLGAFGERFPRIRTTTEIFVIDGDRCTCSGGTAALDMMLQLITTRDGRALANDVSEQFIHPRIRDTHDSQRMAMQSRLGVANEKLIAADRHDGGGQRRAAAGAGDRRRRRPVAAAARAPVRHATCARAPAGTICRCGSSGRATMLLQTTKPILDVAVACRICVGVAFQPLLPRRVRPQAERRARRSAREPTHRRRGVRGRAEASLVPRRAGPGPCTEAACAAQSATIAAAARRHPVPLRDVPQGARPRRRLHGGAEVGAALTSSRAACAGTRRPRSRAADSAANAAATLFWEACGRTTSRSPPARSTAPTGLDDGAADPRRQRGRLLPDRRLDPVATGLTPDRAVGL